MTPTITTVHERRARVVFGKRAVESILKEQVLAQLDWPHVDLKVEVEWRETSIDSGLRKEPELVVFITQDMTHMPAAVRTTPPTPPRPPVA